MLASLLHARTVAMIGPAGYLMAHDATALLTTSVEVIVRPNVQVDFLRSRLRLPPRTTTRCDVVYHSGVAEHMNVSLSNGLAHSMPPEAALSPRTLQIYAQAGVRAVVLAQGSATRRKHFEALQREGWNHTLHMDQVWT